MDEDPRTAGQAVSEERTPEEIRREIEQTREEVGDTVEALAAKTDVKAQARARVDEVKANVHAKADEAKAKAREHTPSSAQEGAATVATKARENKMVLLGAGALLVAFWLGRRSGREV
jgi:transcriptional regulator